MKKLTFIICLTLVSGFAFAQNMCIGGLDLNSVYFTDKNTGYAVGGEWCGDRPSPSQIIIKTINGGTTWDTLSSGTNTVLNSVFFTDSITGYAVGEYGTIIKTTNGGTNWDTLVSGTIYDLNSVYFTNTKTGYVVGASGTILRTATGGATWDTLLSGSIYNLNSVFFTDDNTGFVVGGCNPGLLRSGGYDKLNERSDCYFEQIILKTIDGGVTWTAIANERAILHSVFFIDANTGYAVGENGESIKTIDGGLTWNNLETTGYLSSVYFTDANTGYAVGENYWGGSILKTIDGGTTWTTLSIGKFEGLNSVYFTDANTGYAVGKGGTILKTINTGGFPTAVENVLQQSTFTVYPNPATNKISIATKSNLQGETFVYIFNMNGALLQQQKFESQNLIEMDVSALAKGIYLLQIQTKAGVETKKLVVQ